MKRLVISMSIFVLVFFGLVPILFGAEDANSQPAKEATQPVEAKAQPAKETAKVIFTSDVNVTDPNEIRRRTFGGLEKAMEQVDEQSKEEISQWMEGEIERKQNLMKAVHERSSAEFNLIREVAVKEGAVKTTAAIDQVIKDREERYNRLINRLEEVKKTGLKQQREERRKELEERRRERRDRRGEGEEPRRERPRRERGTGD